MEKKRRLLGFETPAMKIQEEYKEILEQITAKKTDWEKILLSCTKSSILACQMVDNFIKSTDAKHATQAQTMELEHRIMNAVQSITLALVTRIGKELAECDVRIAAVEKELKDLRKGMK